MVGGVTLLVGGARSGKSDLSVAIGRRYEAGGGSVAVVATGQAVDADMADRIARHRADRPGWPTVEEPLDLATAFAAVGPEPLVILDCLTLWVSNCMVADLDDDDVVDRAMRVCALATARPAPTVVVSNEVGQGVHPETELGRRYRDLLGRVNRVWCERADRSLLLVAGRAVALSDPWELLR